MKITNGLPVAKTKVDAADRKAAKKTGEAFAEVLTEKVSVSEGPKEASRLKDEVKALPEVREDRVSEIRNAIESGTYEVDSRTVAGKMIREALLDRFV